VWENTEADEEVYLLDAEDSSITGLAAPFCAFDPDAYVAFAAAVQCDKYDLMLSACVNASFVSPRIMPCASG